MGRSKDTVRGKPPVARRGRVAVRAGTRLARLLALADGTRTLDQCAELSGLGTRHRALSALRSAWARHGVGYALVGGKLLARRQSGKSLTELLSA